MMEREVGHNPYGLRDQEMSVGAGYLLTRQKRAVSPEMYDRPGHSSALVCCFTHTWWVVTALSRTFAERCNKQHPPAKNQCLWALCRESNEADLVYPDLVNNTFPGISNTAAAYRWLEFGIKIIRLGNRYAGRSIPVVDFVVTSISNCSVV